MPSLRVLASAIVSALILGSLATPLVAQAPVPGGGDPPAGDQASQPKPPPGRAVVGGRHLQPTPTGNEEGATAKELPPDDAKTVDQLFEELTKGPSSRDELAKKCKPGTC
jgi:hypothetical protein